MELALMFARPAVRLAQLVQVILPLASPAQMGPIFTIRLVGVLARPAMWPLLQSINVSIAVLIA